MASGDMDHREVFENIFAQFVETLRVLTSDACTQAEMEGLVPGELQWDMTTFGLGALRASGPYLDWEHAEKILDLVAAVRRLPDDAVSVPYLNMGRDAGRATAVNHPAWEPLRRGAGELLVLLEPSIQRNQYYFLNDLQQDPSA
jgi:hypothetical protein